TCGLDQDDDQENADPRLDKLATNLGVPTHALLSNSPAIDHGNFATCEALDERDEDRVDGPPDLGDPNRPTNPADQCDIAPCAVRRAGDGAAGGWRAAGPRGCGPRGRSPRTPPMRWRGEGTTSGRGARPVLPRSSVRAPLCLRWPLRLTTGLPCVPSSFIS